MARRKEPSTHKRTAGARGKPPGKHAGKAKDRRPTPSHTVAHLPARGQPFTEADAIWLYGVHAVRAALANEHRRIRRLLTRQRLDAGLTALAKRRQVAPQTVDRATLEAALPPDAVHQGLALLVDPLPALGLDEVLETCDGNDVILVLDQVTDPHNVGAILRSSAAFSAKAVVVQSRHAPPANGTLAKAASGALEIVPLVPVTNLARALGELADRGFLTIGLDHTGGTAIADADVSGPVALVLGAEGSGLRRLTRERCQALVRLPTDPRLAELNVSNAAAICLYVLATRPE